MGFTVNPGSPKRPVYSTTGALNATVLLGTPYLAASFPMCQPLRLIEEVAFGFSMCVFALLHIVIYSATSSDDQ